MAQICVGANSRRQQCWPRLNGYVSACAPTTEGSLACTHGMKSKPSESAAVSLSSPQNLALSGPWTARTLGALVTELDAVSIPAGAATLADASHIEAMDTAGAWLLQKLLQRLREQGAVVTVQGLSARHAHLLEVVARQLGEQSAKPAVAAAPNPTVLARIGLTVARTLGQALALLAFVGETATVLARCIAHPARLRWRPILFNIRTAGFDALPIVGLLSFLLGVVVAYQGADQLRQYGANIFIADLVGVSMLREFAPLITAIIVAGRSGSAYAAQIGTMVVTEEIDAMRTLAIAPQELLVLPKVIALVIALPLLTVFADVLGVLGGMIMASQQLGVGYVEFLDRLAKAVVVSTVLTGVGKAPVFASIIAVIGCFQGFRTHGGPDSVGRQTTRSVVQSIFLVIVADAMFSIVFSTLEL